MTYFALITSYDFFLVMPKATSVQLRFLGPFGPFGAIWAIRGHLGHSPLPWRTGFLLFPLFSYFVLLAPLKMLRGDVEIPFILIPAF